MLFVLPFHPDLHRSFLHGIVSDSIIYSEKWWEIMTPPWLPLVLLLFFGVTASADNGVNKANQNSTTFEIWKDQRVTSPNIKGMMKLTFMTKKLICVQAKTLKKTNIPQPKPNGLTICAFGCPTLLCNLSWETPKPYWNQAILYGGRERRLFTSIVFDLFTGMYWVKGNSVVHQEVQGKAVLHHTLPNPCILWPIWTD